MGTQNNRVERSSPYLGQYSSTEPALFAKISQTGIKDNQSMPKLAEGAGINGFEMQERFVTLLNAGHPMPHSINTGRTHKLVNAVTPRMKHDRVVLEFQPTQSFGGMIEPNESKKIKVNTNEP